MTSDTKNNNVTPNISLPHGCLPSGSTVSYWTWWGLLIGGYEWSLKSHSRQNLKEAPDMYTGSPAFLHRGLHSASGKSWNTTLVPDIKCSPDIPISAHFCRQLAPPMLGWWCHTPDIISLPHISEHKAFPPNVLCDKWYNWGAGQGLIRCKWCDW